MISRNRCSFGILKQICQFQRYKLSVINHEQFFRLSQSAVRPCTEHPWERSYCSAPKLQQRRQNRLYSTFSGKGGNDQPQSVATPQLLSKLFPQTSIDGSEQEAQQEKQRREEEEEKREKESSWKRMKFGFVFFGFSVSAFCVYTVWVFGAPDRDAEGNVIEDEFIGLPMFQQYFKRLWKSMTYYQKMIQEPSREKLLPDPLKYPYAQPPYTLVLEMKDVLVHPDWTYQTGWRFKKRPGVDKFLETLAANYEIVVFTADQGMTVFPILDALDPRGYIMYRLVRDATHFVDGHHVKNLDNLNRDLSKVIVVDWDPNSTKLHPENTLNIPRWTGNDDDSCNAGRACEMDCPAGLHFNSVLSICDWPHQACCDPTVECRPDPCIPGVTCPPNGPAPTPPAPAPPAPAPPAPSPPADDGCNACALNCVPNTDCPSFNPARPVFLAHPNCSRYYVCETGRACEMVCPEGLHFNIREWVCDFPHRACCDPTIECVPDSCVPGVTCP